MITLTYDICMSIGRDAGDRNMRKRGRKKWNRDDQIVAAERANKLFRMQTIKEGE